MLSPSAWAILSWIEAGHDPAETRYGVAVDFERAADLYAQGWTLRQIGAELGVTATTVSHQLRRAGVTMRRGGPSAHPASTQQILDLRDQGLTWPEIAEQVGMTVSGAWSRYRRARPPRSPRLGRCQQVSPTPWIRTLRLASERPSLIISVGPLPGLS
jgi:predicted DNA-binding transcriptional regulator AlpA